MSLTRVTQWRESGRVWDMCVTSAGHIALRLGWGSDVIRVVNRVGETITEYTGLCGCDRVKNISELSAGQYLAQCCWVCQNVKVVDRATRKIHTAYAGTGCELLAMCSGPGEGSLLVWDNKGRAVIHLTWVESSKRLDEIRRVQVPGGRVVRYMCYMPQHDRVILSRGHEEVEAVRLQGGGQPPVWQVQGEVLGKEISPRGVSSDSEGRVYIADYWGGRVLVVNVLTGEVIQELLQHAGLGEVKRVCCLSNPSQLLLQHLTNTYTLSLYKMTSL